MRQTFLTITDSHRAVFGASTREQLRRLDGTEQQRQWAGELADQLTATRLRTLGEAPAGWGWLTDVPSDAGPPARSWRIKIGPFSTRILRNARDAFQIDYSDRFAARIADLGVALERDGYARLDDAPDNWNWVPGGR